MVVKQLSWSHLTAHYQDISTSQAATHPVFQLESIMCRRRLCQIAVCTNCAPSSSSSQCCRGAVMSRGDSEENDGQRHGWLVRQGSSEHGPSWGGDAQPRGHCHQTRGALPGWATLQRARSLLGYTRDNSSEGIKLAWRQICTVLITSKKKKKTTVSHIALVAIATCDIVTASLVLSCWFLSFCLFSTISKLSLEHQHMHIRCCMHYYIQHGVCKGCWVSSNILAKHTDTTCSPKYTYTWWNQWFRFFFCVTAVFPLPTTKPLPSKHIFKPPSSCFGERTHRHIRTSTGDFCQFRGRPYKKHFPTAGLCKCNCSVSSKIRRQLLLTSL